MRQRIVRRERGAAECDRLEVRLARLDLECLEVESRLGEDGDGRVAMQPRLQQDLVPRRVGANHVETFAAGGDGGAPAVTGSRGLVDDQRSDCAPACSFLELVGPARVVGGCVPAEPAAHRIAGPSLEIGIVDQEDRDLALEVVALVVVPAALRRRDAIADEHEWRALDHDAIHRPQREGLDVLVLHERQFHARDRHADLCVVRHLRAHERHGLRPAARVAPGLEAERLELCDEVLDRLRLARRAGCAPLEFIGGQHFRDARHPFAADGSDVLGEGGRAVECEHRGADDSGRDGAYVHEVSLVSPCSRCRCCRRATPSAAGSRPADGARSSTERRP